MSNAIQIVNGFQCRNCSDVDYAKKHIDPAHPKDGPYGINAKDDQATNGRADDAVTFGGALSNLNPSGLKQPSLTDNATSGDSIPVFQSDQNTQSTEPANYKQPGSLFDRHA